MKTGAAHSTRLAVLSAVVFLVLSPVHAQQAMDVWARTVLHADGSRTVSKKDSKSRIIEERTYTGDDFLLMKRLYQIDEKGNSQRGFVFDNNNNMIYRIAYAYDEIDRLREEVLYNMNGQVVRRQIYDYDHQGKPMRPKAFTFVEAIPGNAPTSMQPAAVMEKASRSGSNLAPQEAGSGNSARADEGKEKKKRFLFFFKRKDKNK